MPILNVASFNGQTIDVEGWFIGATTAQTGVKYLTTLAVKVSANASVPSVVFTDQPTQFAATSPAQQTLGYTANAAAGTVTFDITGKDATKFAVVSNTTSQVVIKAVGNNTDDVAYEATLNAKGSAGTVLASVALSQAVEGATTLEVDFTAQGWVNQQAITSLTVAPLTFTFAGGGNANVPKYYTSGTSLRMYAKNTMTITGATITKIEFTYGDRDEFSVATGTLDGATWTGSSNNLVFTVVDTNSSGKPGQGKIVKMKITYTE